MPPIRWGLSAWNWIRNSAVRHADRQRESGTYQIWDQLRHADINHHRYKVTIYLRGGGAITGRMAEGGYANSPLGSANGALSIWHVGNDGRIDYDHQTFIRLDQVAAVTVTRSDMPKD